MYNKIEVLVQTGDKPECSGKEQTEKQGTHLLVKVGDPMRCPECKAMGRVVWVSQDKKKMGVQCHASHREASKPESKFGATKGHSVKTRRNVVFLMPIE